VHSAYGSQTATSAFSVVILDAPMARSRIHVDVNDRNARLRRRLAACFVAVAASLANAEAAQDSAASYPSKPVRVIIPFVAGGSTDSEARLFIDKLQASLKQPFVYDFRGGAGGSIGAMQFLNATPDGYTIMIANTGLTIFPNFYPQLSHHAVSQFVPITELSNRTTAVITSPAALPNVHTLKELTAWGKANPGKLNCNTSGAGGVTHIVCVGLSNAIGVPITPIYYKGIAQGQIDLIAGRTQVSAGTLTAGLGQIKLGKLRAIAIYGTTRSPLLPDVPTTVEQGYDVAYPSWLGAFAPARTPQPIVTKLNAEFVNAVKSPDVTAALEKLGTTPIASTSDEFRKKFQSHIAYWKQIVQRNNIKLE
jgi:tripartite-type tricarboxylate transporter receptor subunit TctC